MLSAVVGLQAVSLKPKPLVPLISMQDVSHRLITSSPLVPILLVAVVAWELGMLSLKAARQRFWYDEVFTFNVANLHPYSLHWKALREGVDAMPPGYYLLIRLVRKLRGDPHIAFRLPSIATYILSLLGVYWFAIREVPASAALTAVILMTLSPFRRYALQARPYSLLVGFLAISAALWQRVGGQWYILPLLALFLTLAVSCHYFAIIAIPSFGVAELTRTLASQQIRLGVWIALCIAIFPFVAGLPLLVQFRRNFGRSFFARPNWTMVFETYGDYLGLDYKLVVVLVLSFAIAIRDGNLALPEAILLACFLLYPAVLVVITKLLHSGYTPRYGWPAIFGLVLVPLYVFHSFWFKPSSFWLVLAFLIGFAVQALQDLTSLPKSGSTRADERWSRLAEFSRHKPGIPVVIGGGLAYMEAIQYSPPELRDRLVRVIDPDSASRFAGWDTADKATNILAPYLHLRVEGPAAFRAANRSFILYSGGAGDWFTHSLIVEGGYQLKLLWKDRDTDSAVYIAEAPS